MARPGPGSTSPSRRGRPLPCGGRGYPGLSLLWEGSQLMGFCRLAPLEDGNATLCLLRSMWTLSKLPLTWWPWGLSVPAKGALRPALAPPPPGCVGTDPLPGAVCQLPSTSGFLCLFAAEVGLRPRFSEAFLALWRKTQRRRAPVLPTAVLAQGCFFPRHCGKGPVTLDLPVLVET